MNQQEFRDEKIKINVSFKLRHDISTKKAYFRKTESSLACNPLPIAKPVNAKMKTVQ